MQNLIRFKDFLCAIFGHKYYVRQTFSYTDRKVGCSRCQSKWAMSDRTQSFVEWDGEFEEMYNNDERLVDSWLMSQLRVFRDGELQPITKS